jgi:hypothetical protein
MKTALIALAAVLTLAIETCALAADEAQPAASEESAPADTNATSDTPAEPPAAAEEGSTTDAMPAPTESESK